METMEGGERVVDGSCLRRGREIGSDGQRGKTEKRGEKEVSQISICIEDEGGGRGEGGGVRRNTTGGDTLRRRR